MKLPRVLTPIAAFLGAPLLFAAAAGAAKLSFDRWTYIQADNDRVPTSKKKGSFGIAFADVNGDGKIDIASGAHFYRNPGGDMTKAWSRVDLPKSPATGNAVDAGLLFNVNGSGPARDIIAEDLPNVIWLHTEDPNGAAWTAKVVAQMPPPKHGNGRMIKLAKLTQGAKRPDVLLTAGGGIYLMRAPDNPAAGNWPIVKITSTEADEQKAIGLGDIDGDGHVDVVVPAGQRLPEIEWWRNPGDGSTALWQKHVIGKTVNMSKMIEVVDVNGDGRLDVVATDSENVDSGLFWFEAPAKASSGGWKRHDIAKGYNGLDSLSVADMNGDGTPDIVIGETKDRLRLVIYENVGGGKSWRGHLVSEGKESHKGANAVDLDGDGDLDLVSIAYFGFKDLHVWRNDSRR
jgi:hypothetical protein